MGAIHIDTYWPSEEEEANEIVSVSADGYYLTLGSAVCSYPHMCAAVLLVPFSLRRTTKHSGRPPAPPGEWEYHRTRKSTFAFAAAPLQNLNEL